MLGDLAKLIVAKGFKKLPKVQKIARSGHTGIHKPVKNLKAIKFFKKLLFHHLFLAVQVVLEVLAAQLGLLPPYHPLYHSIPEVQHCPCLPSRQGIQFGLF